MDRRILNMDADLIWQKMHGCVQRIIGAYASGTQMEESFADVVRHARRLIQDMCDQYGVAPHDCVCAVYCFMRNSGYYTVPQFQVLLAALVKGEEEIMAAAYAEAQRRQARGSRALVVIPAARAAQQSVVAQQQVVVNNHTHHYPPKDAKSLEELERKVNELLRVLGGQEERKAPAPSAPPAEGDWMAEFLRTVRRAEGRNGG